MPPFRDPLAMTGPPRGFTASAGDRISAMRSSLADLLHFLRSWAADPLRVAAIAPSSESLARLITREIVPSQGPVLELGPGTGVFTRGLLARGLRESDLTLIECEPDFARLLRQRFAQARVLQMDAARVGGSELFPGAVLGAVVSGLPLLSIPLRKVIRILAGAFRHLRQGGNFYQFTYGPRCPVPRPVLDRLGLKATRVGHTLLNLPPAAVYRIARRQPLGVGLAPKDRDDNWRT